MPLVQRITMVGSGTSGTATSACPLRNEWGLGFDVEVFASSVQGKHALRNRGRLKPRRRPGIVVLVLAADRRWTWTRSTIWNCAGPSAAPSRSDRNRQKSDLSVPTSWPAIQNPTAVATACGQDEEQSLLLEWSGQMETPHHQRLAWERERCASDPDHEVATRQMLQGKVVSRPPACHLVAGAASLERQTQRIGQLHQTSALKPTTPGRRFSSTSPRQDREGRRVAVQGRCGRTSISQGQHGLVTSYSNQDG